MQLEHTYLCYMFFSPTPILANRYYSRWRPDLLLLLCLPEPSDYFCYKQRSQPESNNAMIRFGSRMGSRCTLLIYISSSVVRESLQQICIEKTLSSRTTLLRLHSLYNFSPSFILHYPAQSSRKGVVMRRWFILRGEVSLPKPRCCSRYCRSVPGLDAYCSGLS
jgi:hypothetical protein